MEELIKLLEDIYNEIKGRNTYIDDQSIPQSDEFYEKVAKKFSLIPYTIPKLIKILVDSHKIFSFDIVAGDIKKKIRKVEGFIITDGAAIKAMRLHFEDMLIKLYSMEFTKKLPADKIIKEFVPILNDYNNTPLGKAANIVMNLVQYEIVLERNILKYGKRWQDKQLETELQNCEPISYFVIDQSSKSAGNKPEKKVVEKEKTSENKKVVDTAQYADFKKYSTKNSIEKTIAVYGVEFYTRVCFRDYQFNLIQKLVDDGAIKDKRDLLVIKKLLQKERSNSDQDLKIQDFAEQINNLEKSINIRLKQG